MTASATAWPEAPDTGPGRLTAALARPQSTRGHQLEDLLRLAYPHAAAQMARPDGLLATSLNPRDDLGQCDEAVRTRVSLGRVRIGIELLEDLGRSLMHAQQTLTAIAAGQCSPVHGHERPALAATVARRLRVLGCCDDEVTVRRLTYGAVDAVRDALATLQV